MPIEKTLGLQHLALFVKNLEACVDFYTQCLKMKIVWRPDDDNVYLSSGTDNLALHRAPENFEPNKFQRLDHFGFMLKTPEEVDEWYEYFKENNVVLKSKPKTHRDGARSFYCQDPDGNNIQMIFVP